jgi:hypothetical protein
MRRGHCLVNWKRVHRPKKLRGLGILDIERDSISHYDFDGNGLDGKI